MGYKTVQSGIVFNPGQIAIMLNCYKRISFERLQSKRVIRRSKCFRIEDRIITIKQLLYNIQDCRLTRTGSAVHNHELLNLLRVARHNRPDSPLNLMPLLWRI